MQEDKHHEQRYLYLQTIQRLNLVLLPAINACPNPQLFAFE